MKSGQNRFTTDSSVQTIPRYDSIAFGEAALKLRSFRQELLSANLVNADTPNFKARDINFSEVLQSRLAGLEDARSLGLNLTNVRHIPGRQRVSGPEVLYRTPVQPSVDGNTVDPDFERGHFVKNSVMTEAAIQFLGSSFRSRLAAITGQAS
jgi:flagellar basal-body rod protein FlgB